MTEHYQPILEPVQLRSLVRDWGEELIVADTPQYLGKVLRMRAGTAGNLQYHRKKDETFFLWSGTAQIWFDAGQGLCSVPMFPGQSYHVPPGAVHRVVAVTDCVFFETSTPHQDDRVRMEAWYGEPETGGLPSTR